MLVDVSTGGTWTSIAIRASGCEIMKMISSTSRMSIIGITFGFRVDATSLTGN